jgi:hypothetical protein
MPESVTSDPLSAALDKRLDELFHEDEPVFADPASGQAAKNPLRELKKIVFLIDWEITREGLESFLNQVVRLREVYREDKAVFILLQMLAALGQYIQASRSKVHPATFNVLNSVFSRIEDLVNTPNLSAATRRHLVQAEVDSFQQLRAKIAKRKALQPSVVSGAATYSAVRTAAADEPLTAEMLARMTAELKDLIRREMHALRQLLTSLARR